MLSIIDMYVTVKLVIFVTASFISIGIATESDVNKMNDRNIGNISEVLSIRFDENSILSRIYGYWGKQISISSTNAEIIQRPGTIVLKCGGDTVLQRVSWLFYQCCQGNGEIKKIQLSPDVVSKSNEYYEMGWARSGGMISSFLHIKNVSAQAIAGLYRCDVMVSTIKTETHYFIVGKRETLAVCLPGTDLDDKRNMLKTIQNLVRTAERGFQSDRTYEYILKLGSSNGRTHDYRIRFSLLGKEGTKARDGSQTGKDERNFERRHLIKFEIPDASAPWWIENFIREERTTG